MSQASIGTSHEPNWTAASPLKPLSLELPPDRTFVLHLDARAQPLRRLIGQLEHVTSGRKTHVTSVRELVAFLAQVLRNRDSAG